MQKTHNYKPSIMLSLKKIITGNHYLLYFLTFTYKNCIQTIASAEIQQTYFKKLTVKNVTIKMISLMFIQVLNNYHFKVVQNYTFYRIFENFHIDFFSEFVCEVHDNSNHSYNTLNSPGLNRFFSTTFCNNPILAEETDMVSKTKAFHAPNFIKISSVIQLSKYIKIHILVKYQYELCLGY